MKLTYWNDKSGKHRWRLRAANGEIVCASTEGFGSRRAMFGNIQLTISGLNENADKVLDDERREETDAN